MRSSDTAATPARADTKESHLGVLRHPTRPRTVLARRDLRWRDAWLLPYADTDTGLARLLHVPAAVLAPPVTVLSAKPSPPHGDMRRRYLYRVHHVTTPYGWNVPCGAGWMWVTVADMMADGYTREVNMDIIRLLLL